MPRENMDPWDSFWDSKADLGGVYPSSPRVLEAVLGHLPPGDRRVLEIGAGTGRDTAALRRRGFRAIALDAAPASLALIARSHPDLAGRGVVGADAFHLPFPDAAFDAVFHQGVLEHFGNPAAFLAENFRVTVPGGLLVVDVPQTFHPWTLLKRTLIRVDRWFAGWETDFTIGELERAIRGAGFEIVGSYGDWMVPSLGYRLLRETGRRASVNLPLNPRGPSALRAARRALRSRLLEKRPLHHVAHTIGVIARRSDHPGI